MYTGFAAGVRFVCTYLAGLFISVTLRFLTLEAPITTAADDVYKYFFHCFSEKIRLDVSCESS